VRVLVTGGAGFVGSHYVRSALSGDYPGLADAEVVVLDKLTYAGHRANLAPVAGSRRLRFVEGDVADAGLVDALTAEADEVVHFAAESHVDRSIRGAADFVTTNVVGTQNLLEAARRNDVAGFVHVSTDEVYGSIDSGSWAEERPLDPSSPYSASKAGGDLLARAYHRTHGLPVRLTRCCNTYGPYQMPEKVIPLFVTRLLEGRRVPLYGDGLHRREWLHVDDHCRGVELVRERGRPGETYNIGGGTELSNRELTARLLEECGAGWDRVEPVPDRPGHDRRYSVDVSKITVELGYAPAVPFASGLRETVRWYREHRDWWASMPESWGYDRTSLWPD
jgi:dTDP-glucose 4,6-dehydratase